MSLCTVARKTFNLEDIVSLGLDGFVYECQRFMPKKLYKYFPSKTFTDDNDSSRNYSLDALHNNTVFLQSPINFDDPYDSSFFIDEERFICDRACHYLNICGISYSKISSADELVRTLTTTITDAVQTNLLLPDGNPDPLHSLFAITGDDSFENLNRQVFASHIDKYFQEHPDDPHIWYHSVCFALYEEYQMMKGQINRTLRITCFSTSPYSMLMWSHYANYHEGFCIEYDLDAQFDDNERLKCHLHPVIYSEFRTDVTPSRVQEYFQKGISEQHLWESYCHGLLRKSMDWSYQDEWRLILPFSRNDSNYSISIFPISKVYLGNRMKSNKRNEIIEWCHQMKIPYSGVVIRNDRYQMEDCSVLCEDCQKHQRNRL